MQTFLPYPDFEDSARALDNKRLGKQRSETQILLTSLICYENGWGGYGWLNHPAHKMWRGYTFALAVYGVKICYEWQRRGNKDKLMAKFIRYLKAHDKLGVDIETPPWVGDEDFHKSHQSNLIRKWPEFYSVEFPGVPENLPYVWPVVEEVNV